MKFFRKLGRRRVENLDRRTLERDRIGKSNLPTKLPEISVQVRVKPNPSMRNAKRYNNVTRVSCYFHTCQSQKTRSRKAFSIRSRGNPWPCSPCVSFPFPATQQLDAARQRWDDYTYAGCSHGCLDRVWYLYHSLYARCSRPSSAYFSCRSVYSRCTGGARQTPSLRICYISSNVCHALSPLPFVVVFAHVRPCVRVRRTYVALSCA